MRDILQRLLKREEPPRRFGTVTTALPYGRYVVTDDQGRKMTVDGAAGYLPGTAVIVQSGLITGTGRRPAATKIVKV
jgi:hypothetical protein